MWCCIETVGYLQLTNLIGRALGEEVRFARCRRRKAAIQSKSVATDKFVVIQERKLSALACGEVG